MLTEEGTYFGNLVEAKSVTIGDKKTSALSITFEITHQADGDQWADIDPFMREVLVWLSDKAWDFSQRRLAAMQFNGNFQDPQFDPVMTEKGTQLICSHGKYQGRDQENWVLACWNEKRERGEPSVDEMRKLAARWGMDATAAKLPAGKPSAPPVGDAAEKPEEPPLEDKADYSEPRDGEIPF